MGHQITNYFLLDVEFPYLYRASRQMEKNIAIRFSEDESIATVKNYVGMVDWVWIDTNTRLPITSENKEILNQFKKCLVCPSKWYQADKINDYLNIMSKIRITINAIMTSVDNISNYLF